MKSIIQEASSILKAVEKGWEKAGKPAEFTVKIYEEPQKNFIGMTTKPAKIGIFFQDIPATKPVEEIKKPLPRRDKPTERMSSAPAKVSRPTQRTEAHHEPIAEKRQARPVLAEKKQAQMQNAWNEEMVNIVTQWMNGALSALGRQDMKVSTEISAETLKVTFSDSILNDKGKDKILFRSFAFLLMQTLRNKLRNRLRGLKIMLIGAR